MAVFVSGTNMSLEFLVRIVHRSPKRGYALGVWQHNSEITARCLGATARRIGFPDQSCPQSGPQLPPDAGRFGETVSDDYTTKNPTFPRDSGLYWISLDGNLVEAAGIEPASVNPPRTGDYMLSLSLI